MEYADFKFQYETDPVADVLCQKPIDLSIPYDAAAKVAYEASDKSVCLMRALTRVNCEMMKTHLPSLSLTEM
jgi:hypothetical protein